MAYENIKEISSQNPRSGFYYFLDANIWVYAMSCIQTLHNPDKGNSLYTNFFFAIIDSTLRPRPRIILNSMIMSEIINTFLKKYAMHDYLYTTFKSKGITTPENFDYKNDYRKTLHYDSNLRMILDEIKSYHESICLIDDSFMELKPFQFGRECPANMDFNDYYNYLIACKLNRKYKDKFAFISNDGDFKINDFEIYTASKALLDLRI